MSYVRNINEYLLDEILIEIFTYLSTSRRLQVQRVCHRWKYLLRSSPRFIVDRHVFFSNCILDDEMYPGKMILESEVNYVALSLGINCTITDNCKELWKKLQNITSLDISKAEGYKFPRECATMLNCMKNLKVLTVENQESCVGVERDHWPIVYFPGVLLSVQELRVNHLNGGELHSLLRSIQMCPNLKRLYLGSVWHLSVTELENFLEKCEKILKSISIDWDDIGSEVGQKRFLEKFKSFSNLKLERLSVTSLNTNYDVLRNLCLAQPRIKLIDVSCSNHPILSEFVHKITSLSIRFHRCITNFEALHRFTSLQELKVFLSYRHPTGCFFGHEILKNESLKRFILTIPYAAKACTECYHAMTLSYPNLKELEVIGDGIGSESWAVIIKNLKKLKILSISNVLVINALEKVTSEGEIGVNTRLKTLILENLTHVSIATINTLADQFPLVQDLQLSISYYTSPLSNSDVEEIISQILTKFSELKRLEFDICSRSFDHSPSESFIHQIIEKGRSLKILRVPFMRIPVTTAMVLFRCLPCLFRIVSDSGNITRKDYYDIELNKSKTLDEFLSIPHHAGWRRFAVTEPLSTLVLD